MRPCKCLFEGEGGVRLFGFIGNIGPWELILILAIALIVVGPGKLPDVARSLGKATQEFKKATSGVRKEFEDVMRPDPSPVPVVHLPDKPDISPSEDETGYSGAMGAKSTPVGDEAGSTETQSVQGENGVSH